ncbi:MAG: PQQ-dependent sugar dehydrogenase [Solirubrobacterales bacterium]
MQASRRGTSAALAAAAAAGLLLASCGGGDEATTTAAQAPPVNVLPAGKRVARLDKVAWIRRPTSVVQPPGNTNLLFVTTKPGQVLVLKNGKLRQEPFLDLVDEVNSDGSEQGMFSIAFAPDYAKSRRFYVAYNLPDNSVQIDEYKRSADNSVLADPESRRPIINAPHGMGEREQHNGGELQFGPDGYLYIGFGDGGPVTKPFVSNRAQQRSRLLGKILRIDPLNPGGSSLPYAIPPDNPFIGRPGERPEIYAYGLRNPYRFSFDTTTGALLIGDPGAADVEEIDYQPKGQAKGKNFGWPRFEGNRPFRTDHQLSLNNGQPPEKPIHTYTHELGCSVIGGYVIHDPRIPQLDGDYIYGDACSGDLRVLEPAEGKAVNDHSLGLRLSPTKDFGIVSFGQGSDGRIYAASFTGGVYALNPEHKKK